MSLNDSCQKAEKDCSLLHSGTFHHVFGGDAMQALRCGICTEFFEVPIVLPCGHTFCLHCLTELCRKAMQATTPSCPVQETRIGCPNCRVLIYASPILDRNVTCNFVIQSLIESLKERKLETRVNKAVNTDEARVGSKIKLVGDLEIDRIIQEVDRLSDAIDKRSVLDMAYFEVDKIRREHLAAEGMGRVASVENTLSHVGPRNPWRTNTTNRSQQTHTGLHTQQQKQWAHLMQQQKCAQQFNSQQQRQQPQQQQQTHYQQQLQQRSSQREPIRTPASAWSQHCFAKKSRFAPSLPEPTSFPSQPSSSTVFSTASTSSATSYSGAPVHTPSASLRQQPRTHQVHPAPPQRQIQLLQRQEQQQPQTSQSFFQIRRKQELYQTQHQPQHQQLQQDNDKKQQYLFQQQQQHLNKPQRLLQRPAPYQGHPLHTIDQYQPQQRQQQEDQATGSKMAAVTPVQRSAGVEGNEPMSSTHVGHPAQLDNDPAVMSYSYRAESVLAAESSNLP